MYSKPYNFLDQLFELFSMALLLFQFKQLEKLVFLAYKELDCTHINMTSQKLVPHFSELGPGHFQKTYIHRNVIPKGFCFRKIWSKLLKRTLFWLHYVLYTFSQNSDARFEFSGHFFIRNLTRGVGVLEDLPYLSSKFLLLSDLFDRIDFIQNRKISILE